MKLVILAPAGGAEGTWWIRLFPRADVAEFVLAQLESDRHLRQAVSVTA